MPTGMLPMLDATDPNNRTFNLATICVCVVSVGYLAHNPRIVTRMEELRVIIIVHALVAHCVGCLRYVAAPGGGAMAAVRQRRPPWSKGLWFSQSSLCKTTFQVSAPTNIFVKPLNQGDLDSYVKMRYECFGGRVAPLYGLKKGQNHNYDQTHLHQKDT